MLEHRSTRQLIKQRRPHAAHVDVGEANLGPILLIKLSPIIYICLRKLNYIIVSNLY